LSDINGRIFIRVNERMALVLVACLILGEFIHVSDSLCLEVEQRAMTDPTAKECKPNNRSAGM